MEGPEALDVAVAQLEGFAAPAAAWETEILPARIAGYEPAWLDDRCLAGRLAWARPTPRNGRAGNGERKAAPVRTTPITLAPRRHAALWAPAAAAEEGVQPSPRARIVADYIAAGGNLKDNPFYKTPQAFQGRRQIRVQAKITF